MDFMKYFDFVLSDKSVLKHRFLMDFGQKKYRAHKRPVIVVYWSMTIVVALYGR